MQTLDLWLEYIETGQRLPLFQQMPKEYTLQKPKNLIAASSCQSLAQIVEHQNISALRDLTSVDEYATVFTSLLEIDNKSFLLKCFDQLLGSMHLVRAEPKSLLQAMIDFLRTAPFLAISFGRCHNLHKLPEDLATLIEVSALPILRSFVISATEAEDFVISPFRSMLAKIPDGALSLRDVAELIELTSLTVRTPEVALDLLLGCVEPESSRVMSGQPEAIRHLVKNMIAISLDHIGEAAEQGKEIKGLFDLNLLPETVDGCSVVEVPFRIDAPGGTPENSAHVRLTAATLPTNVMVGKRYSIDALATHSEQGLARFRCLHPLPPFFRKCSWNLENCGPFATTKTTFDAVCTLATELEGCCQVAGPILGMPPTSLCADPDVVGLDWRPVKHLNSSQNAAVKAVLRSSLTCLWGPPGTGKTETIVEMICAVQEAYKDARILVTAPTHNAVDNVMRRYTRRLQERPLLGRQQPSPLRVSTDVSSEDPRSMQPRRC